MTFSFRFKQIARDFGHICHTIHEAERDIITALFERKAMNAGNRVKSEFKAVAGVAGLAVGCMEANPVAIFCSAGSVGEGLYDLERAGHKYRLQHPEPKRRVS